MQIVITGATGYIGNRLVVMAQQRGHQVTTMSRRRPLCSGVAWVPFEFSEYNSIALPCDAQAIVHLAAVTSGNTSVTSTHEVHVAEALLAACEQMGAHFVYVSSQAARADAPSLYSQTKWSIERRVLSAEGTVIRPGLVYGGAGRGLFGKLLETARRSPMLPEFHPAPLVQPIHIDDLALALLKVVEQRRYGARVVCLGPPQPIGFSTFLIEMVRTRLRRTRLIVPVPVWLVEMLRLLLGNRLGAQPQFDQLHSLFTLPVMRTEADLKDLALTLRPLRAGMHRSGDNRRRRLLQEGRTLFRYLMTQDPTSSLLRRYVRCVEDLRGGEPLALGNLTLRFPVFVTLFDDRKSTNPLVEELNWRLDAATVLMESTPQGACLFLGIGYRSGRVGNLGALVSALLGEAVWRFLTLAYHPVASILNRRDRESG